MKRSFTPLAAAMISGSLLFTSMPAFAASTTTDRCLRVTGRELERCIAINNQTRIRLRSATLETKTRAQLRRAERVVDDRKKNPDNVLDRVRGLKLDEVRSANAAQGSQRRRLQEAISTSQSKCQRFTGIRKAACMRESFRTDVSE